MARAPRFVDENLHPLQRCRYRLIARSVECQSRQGNTSLARDLRPLLGRELQ
jgi:hypothetical protein